MESTLNGIGVPVENMKWIHFPSVNLTTDDKRIDFLNQLPTLIN